MVQFPFCLGKHLVGVCSNTSACIAAPLLNACIPSSVAFSVYDSKVILSDFKALHFRVESSIVTFCENSYLCTGYYQVYAGRWTDRGTYYLLSCLPFIWPQCWARSCTDMRPRLFRSRNAPTASIIFLTQVISEPAAPRWTTVFCAILWDCPRYVH